MKYLLSALLLLTATACTPAQSPTTVRANARAAVTVAKSTYVLVANACLDAAQISSDEKIATACADALDPAYNLIVDAAAAVDGMWTPAAACELFQAVTFVAKASTALGTLSKVVEPAVQDAQTLATAMLGGSCASPSDAGAQ